MLEEFVRAAQNLPFIPNTEALDQHLLVDAALVRILVDSADVGTGDVVLDVGAGLGVISAELATRAGVVVAAEIDQRFAPALRTLSARTGNVRAELRSLREVDLARMDAVVGNPPFGQVEWLMGAMDNHPNITRSSLVLGSRSVEALTARPGDAAFGRLSLLTWPTHEVRQVAEVPRTAFIPVPGTDAGIVALHRRAAQHCTHRILRVLARSLRVHGGRRVRDVAALIRSRLEGCVRHAPGRDDLTRPDLWPVRLQRLSHTDVSLLAADLVRVARED